MSNNVHLGIDIVVNGYEDGKKKIKEVLGTITAQAKATKDLNAEQKKNSKQTRQQTKEQKELSRSTTYLTDAERKLIFIEQQRRAELRKTWKAEMDTRNVLQNLNAQQKKNSEQTRQQTKEQKELSRSTKYLTDAERKLMFAEQQRRSELRKTWKAEADHRNVLQKFAQSRIGQLVAPIVTVATFSKILNDTKEFDKLTRKIQGVTHATEADMKILNKKSLEVAAKYGISSIELQHDVFDLTKTWNHGTEKILNNLDAIAKASIATSSVFGDTASVYLKLENAFGNIFSPEQLANAVTFLGDAVGSTMTEIDYATTEAVISAKAHKVELKDMASLIGVLSMSGVKGSNAGTAIKQIISRLADPKIEKHLKLMGLTFKDVNIDQVGIAKSMENMQSAIEKMKLKKGGSVVVQGLLKAMFGEAADKISLLLNNQQQYGAFGKQFEEFNSAKIAGKQLQSFSVKIAQAKEGLSQLGLNIGTHLMPVFINMIDGANFLFNTMTKAGSWVGTAFEKFTSGLGETGKVFAWSMNFMLKRAEAAMIGGILGFFLPVPGGAAAGATIGMTLGSIGDVVGFTKKLVGEDKDMKARLKAGAGIFDTRSGGLITKANSLFSDVGVGSLFRDNQDTPRMSYASPNMMKSTNTNVNLVVEDRAGVRVKVNEVKSDGGGMTRIKQTGLPKFNLEDY